ncbi:hypothetical protein POM88_053938 [Heracleum sosnowskyi]|uniref:Uncharacterized protein n=1 Tax=Heracleum sosnowskyi TaxID=360622 RepID=A0AAD8LXE6_9APIA|nr:hypothetical protein POM88_053938 [Heracleum sosnowskyi]
MRAFKACSGFAVDNSCKLNPNGANIHLCNLFSRTSLTPDYVLYHYLCKRALDWFYARKVELDEDVSLLRKEFDSENSCYHLRMAFEDCFPAEESSDIPHNRYESFGPGVLKEIEKFNTDVKNSGGFYAGHYPEMYAARIYGTWISKCYDIDNKPIPASSLTKLLHLSQLALCFYNMKEGTEFNNVKVLRAMTCNCGRSTLTNYRALLAEYVYRIEGLLAE